MAKITKGAAAPKTETASAASTVEAIDISKLTPEQLASLQKQLKATKKVTNEKSKERFTIIDAMLVEKDEAGAFKHTTRDILNVLQSEKLVVTNCAEDEQNEIKKIQARKQFLEKRRDEKGELISPEGTYGYKASSAMGFKLSGQKVTDWFTPENVATLTEAQSSAILKALA
jgi:hypothetical protein